VSPADALPFGGLVEKLVNGEPIGPQDLAPAVDLATAEIVKAWPGNWPLPACVIAPIVSKGLALALAAIFPSALRIDAAPGARVTIRIHK
jgi:hypothetical protein